MMAPEQNKIDEIRARAEAAETPAYHRKPFGPEWAASYWIKWATITYALRALGIGEGDMVLDVGVGSGWTTVFLAEQGYEATGTDIGPASVDVGSARAQRYGVRASFVTADMDTMDLGQKFDACLIFDALHHSQRQAEVIERLAAHVKPGGWILFGEPSWLHGISPSAIRTSKNRGWIERGISVTKLKRHCRKSGLGAFRRFYEGSGPTEQIGGVVWQLIRLVLSPVACSPQTSIWLAAQKR
jgi:2-polyprenyl-3-methyl-5-hydroxy-6-metoxy-1,4-benzoquinol methylase